jgi:hypothetical protein
MGDGLSRIQDTRMGTGFTRAHLKARLFRGEGPVQGVMGTRGLALLISGMSCPLAPQSWGEPDNLKVPHYMPGGTLREAGI